VRPELVSKWPNSMTDMMKMMMMMMMIFPISSTIYKIFTEEKVPLHKLRNKAFIDGILEEEEEEVLADLIQVLPLSTPFFSQRVKTHKPTS